MNDPLKTLLCHDKRQKYVIFDFETEGLNLIRSKPFQISWAVYKGGEILEENDHLILWEDLDMSEDAARITKFDWAHYKNEAEDPMSVYQKFEKLLDDKESIFCGHNILNFDVYVLNTWQKLMNLAPKLPMDRVIDTKALATAYMKDLKYDSNFHPVVWQYKMSSIVERGLKTNLEFLLKTFNIDYDPDKLHNALYDIRQNAKILDKLLWKTELPKLEEWSTTQ